MAGITELGYVRFGVKDLDAWRNVLEDLLGLEVFTEPDEENRLYARSDNWHHRFVFDRNDADDMTGAGLRTAGSEEFAGVLDVLEHAGIEYQRADAALARERRVLDLVSLADPGGNPLEIFHGPEIAAHLPFYPGRRMFGRFVTGTGGCGHMILRSDDHAATYEFYRRLGFRGGVEYRFPTPDGAREAMFLHCNDRDHSVAFAQFGPPSSKFINHLMIEVDNFDDVLYTHEMIQQSDYPVVISLGKHANDEMISFYFQSPSLWLIEVGCAGRPATHQSEYYTRDTYGHAFTAPTQPGKAG